MDVHLRAVFAVIVSKLAVLIFTAATLYSGSRSLVLEDSTVCQMLLVYIGVYIVGIY